MEQNFSNRVNQAELADIQTIAVDQTLSKEERIAEFLRPRSKIPTASEWEMLLSMWPIQRVVQP